MSHPRGLYHRTDHAGKQVWYVRVTLNGRRQHFGHFPSQRAAQDFYDRTTYLRREQRVQPGRTQQIEYTVPELFAAYLPQAQHRRAYRDQQRFAAWWSANWPRQRVFDLTPQHIEQARIALRTSGRQQKRTEGTINHYLKCLKRAMRAIVQPRSWVVDLWSQIKIERPEGTPPRPMTPDDEQALQHYLTADDLERVRLCLLTGLRRAQLFGLRWERIQWDHGAVALPTIKRQRERFLPIPQEAIDMLRGRWTTAGRPPAGWVFPNPKNPALPQDPNSWYKYRFKKAVKAAGLAGTGLKFHSTRHAFAVRFLQSGGNVRALQRADGWSDLKQVEIYTQMQDDQIRVAMEQASKIGLNGRKRQNENHTESKKSSKSLKTKVVAV